MSILSLVAREEVPYLYPTFRRIIRNSRPAVSKFKSTNFHAIQAF